MPCDNFELGGVYTCCIVIMIKAGTAAGRKRPREQSDGEEEETKGDIAAMFSVRFIMHVSGSRSLGCGSLNS